MKKPFINCPECDREVEFYDTSEDGRSGRYQCSCGRNTTWAIGKAESILDVLKIAKQKLNNSQES